MSEAVLSSTQQAWADLLLYVNHNVPKATAIWHNSPQLLELAPHPPVAASEIAYRDETDLENQILKELMKRGCVAYHSGAESKTQTNRARAGRPPKGWPDITCLAPRGRILFFEVKTAKGAVSEGQKTMHQRLEGVGHRVHVVRSISEVLSVLEEK